MSESHSQDYRRNRLNSPNDPMPEGMKRLAAVVEYDGSVFCGWQRQSHSPSVQAEVERTLSKVAAEPITVACAGRTDTAVHATNQVIHFDTLAVREPRNWLLGANANLSDGIRLHWVGEMPKTFHARFSATARTYRYVIYNELYRPALCHSALTWQRRPLDAERMQRAANYLSGERDFSSFRGCGLPVKNTQSQYALHRGVAAGQFGNYRVASQCVRAAYVSQYCWCPNGSGLWRTRAAVDRGITGAARSQSGRYDRTTQRFVSGGCQLPRRVHFAGFAPWPSLCAATVKAPPLL